MFKITPSGDETSLDNHHFDDLQMMNIQREGSKLYKTSMVSTKFTKKRRDIKENVVHELLRATRIDFNKMTLDNYIVGKKEKKQTTLHRILKLLGLAELSCQEAVLDGSADELNTVVRRLTHVSILNRIRRITKTRRRELDEYDENGYTALSLAVKAKRYDLVVILVENKVKLDIWDEKTGMTPLMYSIHNRTHEITNLLIKEGADCNLCDYKGVSPLMIACCIDDGMTCLALCSHVLDIDHQDSNGWTPLHYAAFGCSFECCKILLSFGADRSRVDMKNRKPIHIARFKDRDFGKCIAILEEKRAVLSLGAYD